MIESSKANIDSQSKLEQACCSVSDFFIPNSWRSILLLHESIHQPVVNHLRSELKRDGLRDISLLNTENYLPGHWQESQTKICNRINDVDGVINFYSFMFQTTSENQARQIFLHRLLKDDILTKDRYRLFKDLDCNSFGDIFSISPLEIDRINRTLIDMSAGKKSMLVTTPVGTKIIIDLQHDAFPWLNENGFGVEDYELPPGEVATYSSKVEGLLVVGGAMIGTIPIGRKYGIPRRVAQVQIMDSRVIEVASRDQALKQDLEFCLFYDSGTSVVGEVAIGTSIGQKFLTGLNYGHEERFPGFHIGFGSTVDQTIKRPSNHHLDFVFPNSTIMFDDLAVMEDGRFTFV